MTSPSLGAKSSDRSEEFRLHNSRDLKVAVGDLRSKQAALKLDVCWFFVRVRFVRCGCKCECEWLRPGSLDKNKWACSVAYSFRENINPFLAESRAIRDVENWQQQCRCEAQR
jgi:hypothetical protein